jgi:2-hydroxychromene-2-carboxylate isomerase
MKADWYFDFISPYAYLQFSRLGVLDSRLELMLRPVLFAALLDHWGQLGPAEIEPKRRFTYSQARWLARRQGVELVVPEAHPFNPLPLLRLALHLGVTRPAVERLFAFVWKEGHIPASAAAWKGLLEELHVLDGESAIGRPEVKMALRENTEQAIAAGVFGVPSVVVDGRVFWGNDATRMVLDYLDDPAPFIADDARIAELPTAAARPASQRK